MSSKAKTGAGFALDVALPTVLANLIAQGLTAAGIELDELALITLTASIAAIGARLGVFRWLLNKEPE